MLVTDSELTLHCRSSVQQSKVRQKFDDRFRALFFQGVGEGSGVVGGNLLELGVGHRPGIDSQAEVGTSLTST